MTSTTERSGRFGTRDVVRLLQDLAGEEFSGSLRSESGDLVKVLFFAEGRLACASSTDPDDRLGPLLRDANQITAQQLAMAEEKALAGEALGSVLVSLGFIGPAGLMWGAQRQVERVVCSLLTWKEGSFETRAGALPERAVNLKLDVPSVVLGAARVLDDRGAVMRRLGSLDAVFRRRETASPPPLDDDARRIWDLLDGRRDLRTICGESPLDDFEGAKVVLGFHLLGQIEPVERLSATDPTPAADEETLGDLFPAAEEPPPADAGAGIPENPRTNAGPSDAPTPGANGPAGGDAAAPDQPAGVAAGLDGPGERERAATSREEADLPFDETGGYDGTDAGDRSPPPDGGGGGRTWLIGGALVVVALISLYLWLGPDAASPALDATGAGTPDPAVPSQADPAKAAGPEAAEDRAAGVDIPTAPAGRPAEPPPPATDPPRVETTTRDATLAGGSDYEEGLAAFENGDFARAASLWSGGWLSAHRDRFTLQVLVACETATLSRLRRQVDPSDRLFLLPHSISDRSCYRVGWGTYADREAAETALSRVPEYFTASGERPVAVPLARLAP